MSNGAPPWVAVLVFLFSYLLIMAPDLRVIPLGRPGGALVGAFLMIATGVLRPDEAWHAIEPNTIVLLMGMMILTASLDIAGFFDLTATWLLRRFGGGAVGLMHAIVWSSGILSAFLVNDTVCLLMSPLVLTAVRRAGYPRLPFLFALAMGANVGSVATLSGNPQNMLIGALSGDRYPTFLIHLAPVAIGGLAIVSGILHLYFARSLRGAEAKILSEERRPRVRTPLLRLSIGILACVVIAFVVGVRPSVAALGGGCALLVAGRVPPRHLFSRIDWTLLLFFASLFVLVEGVVRAGAAAWLGDAFRPWLGGGASHQAAVFSVLAVIGSNIVSNVPFILVARPWVEALHDPILQWRVLAMATTFAGNLTILGSVANLIVIESADGEERVRFMDHFRVGAPVTVATLAWGLCVLLAMGR
jgi:Na+/H+ antiporter NhaD/arsenite permease-like protein